MSPITIAELVLFSSKRSSMSAFIWSVIANVEVKLLLSLCGVDGIEREMLDLG